MTGALFVELLPDPCHRQGNEEQEHAEHPTKKSGHEWFRSAILVQPLERLDEGLLRSISRDILVAHDAVSHVEGEALIVKNKLIKGR